jgi:signal transduction histidine kinase/DNA-binding response OmpR family regulator/ABC-type sugar transport system substrate-binding protein
MGAPLSRRRTIGFLSSWHVYEDTTIDPILHALLGGMYAAARDQDCDLLLGCGLGLRIGAIASAPAWPILLPHADFVPVGPWNADGIVVAPHPLSDAQSSFVQQLVADGYPIVFTGYEEPGPAVVGDVADGIRQAFQHLLDHGHRQIAFIAGVTRRSVDTAMRLQAYLDALHVANLDDDPRLIAYGEASVEGGRRAMQQILASGAPFTAVLANNDSSGFGAVEALREAGLHVPADIAVIGFDDTPAARAFTPPFTTVRQPIFAQGYQAILAVLERIAGQQPQTPVTTVPPRLVIRQSCGCHSGVKLTATLADVSGQPVQASRAVLARAMATATLRETRHFSPDEVELICRQLVEAYTESLLQKHMAPLSGALNSMLQRVEALDDDIDAWQAAIATVRQTLPTLLPMLPGPASHQYAEALLDHASLQISEQSRRQAASRLIRHVAMVEQLGALTAQLLAVLDEAQIEAILTRHLPHLQIQHLLLALFAPLDGDPVAQSTVLLCAGLDGNLTGRQFATREFPPPGYYRDDASFQLALLPLNIHDQLTGFVALDAANLEVCAAVVRNLASALRSSRLYREALEARRLAEDANRLKSRFLSLVSHELRTPTNLIVGLSDFLLREYNQAHAPSGPLWRDIEQISASARHLGRLIGDVLDLASSEAGQLRLMKEPLNLAEVLSAVLTTGEQLAREKGLAWAVRMPLRGPWVLGDHTRLRQVVLNLISNAVKFTASGSVSLEVTIGDGQVTVSVSDTGLGVPVTVQEDIFGEFRRDERTIQRGYGGLGLGLAICKQLVERQGGTIGVRSSGAEGSGSTFFFTLPTIAPLESLPGPDSPVPARAPTVALLTERVDAIAHLSALLRGRGFDVQVYHMETDADWFPRLLAAPPSAVILDNQLAVRQGWQLIAMLKHHAATEHTPVVVCALDPHEDQGALLELNYLLKPLVPDQLGLALARLGIDALAEEGARTILVVDDDPGILEFHTRLIRQQLADCRVVQARHGREALAVMQQTRPDLVLLDLMMPELDGFGLLQAMRGQETTRDVPVIVLTAQALDEDDMARLNRGVAAILSKGLFGSNDILAHIESVLSSTRTRASAAQQLARRAVAFIHAHYAEPLTRDLIAEHVGISADHLTECFRRDLGVTPIAYLNRFRINRARALLETGHQSVTDVALAVGFSNSAHFSHIFQREVGVSPRAYRRGERPGPGEGVMG